MIGARAMRSLVPGWNSLLLLGRMFVQDVVVEEERPEPERGTHFRRGAEPKETRRPSGPKEEEVRLVVSILAVGFGVLRWFLERLRGGLPRMESHGCLFVKCGCSAPKFWLMLLICLPYIKELNPFPLWGIFGAYSS